MGISYIFLWPSPMDFCLSGKTILHFAGKMRTMEQMEWEGEVSVEEKFVAAWEANRKKAEALGVRLRPVKAEEVMKTARRALAGNRLSDGFPALLDCGHLELSLEALVIDKRFTALFTDEEANNALSRLLDAGYRF